MAITNVDELRQALSGQVQSAVKYLLDQTKIENEKKIDTTVYNGYSPSWYDRTFEFPLAWDVTEENIGDLGGGVFQYEPSKLSVGTVKSGQHISFIGQGSSVEKLPDYIYDGYQGALPIHIPKRDAFKKLDRWLSERQIRILFKRGLKSAGLKVVKEGGATKTEF